VHVNVHARRPARASTWWSQPPGRSDKPSHRRPAGGAVGHHRATETDQILVSYAGRQAGELAQSRPGARSSVSPNSRRAPTDYGIPRPPDDSRPSIDASAELALAGSRFMSTLTAWAWTPTSLTWCAAASCSSGSPHAFVEHGAPRVHLRDPRGRRFARAAARPGGCRHRSWPSASAPWACARRLQLVGQLLLDQPQIAVGPIRLARHHFSVGHLVDPFRALRPQSRDDHYTADGLTLPAAGRA
jgi:hypothetical protein